jgi:hypothetical protein
MNLDDDLLAATGRTGSEDPSDRGHTPTPDNGEAVTAGSAISNAP